MVLVTRFFWPHQRRGDKKRNITLTDGPSTDPIEHRKLSFPRDRKTWLRLFAPKQQQKGERVPTLSGIIKAGDEGVYSSALFNSLHGHPGEIKLESVYNAFSHELRTRPLSERSSYPSDISRFLSTKRAQRGLSRSESRNGRTEVSPKARRASLDFAEIGLRRSISARRPSISARRSLSAMRTTSPMLVNTANVLVFERGSEGKVHTPWAQELQNASNLDGRLSIAVSEREVATLSVILGTPIQYCDEDVLSSTFKNGAYGISIRSTRTADGYTVSLTQRKRKITQLPARGSSYSTLYAKHFASGSLPFSSSPKTTNSILVTAETLEALQSGIPLDLQIMDAITPASDFLSNLPHSRPPTFHTLIPTPEASSISTLLNAIADLPFTGGLPPLASSTLIQTIQFITTGGLIPGRLLQRLEALVDKVHRHSPQLQLFGPLLADQNAGLLFRERERLGKIASGAKNDEVLADKVARMHRYVTLLERLICLIPNMKPHDALNAVREATKKELQRSYEDAVAAFVHKDAETDSLDSGRSYDNPTSSQGSRRGTKHEEARKARNSTAQNVSPTSTLNTATTNYSSRFSTTFPAYNLGSQTEKVLKGSLPFDVETVALVARLIIVAWTLSVGEVGEGEGQFRLPVIEGMGMGVLC